MFKQTRARGVGTTMLRYSISLIAGYSQRYLPTEFIIYREACLSKPTFFLRNSGYLFTIRLISVTSDGFVLRPYQQECLDQCLRRFEEGVQRQAVALPVGSGKTVIFSHLIKYLPPPTNMPNATKTLILAHRRELLQQAHIKVMQIRPETVVHLDSTRGKILPVCADVVIASVQKLGKTFSLQQLNRYDPGEFKLIIIDEAHHAAAASYQRILQKFDVLELNSHIKVWGCSANFERSDGFGLFPLFQEITYEKSLFELIQQKWLSDMLCFHVKSRTSLTRIRCTKNKDFDPTKLANAVNNHERNHLIFKSWHELAYLNGRKSTLIFAASVAHAREIEAIFQLNGIVAKSVDSRTQLEERFRSLEDFRMGRLSVLVNCGVFTEGTDMPCIDCIVMARPTCSKGLFIQMLGRGLRLHSTKENCLIIFIHDDYLKHNLATVPGLFGLHPYLALNGESISDLKSKIDRFSIHKDFNPNEFQSIDSLDRFLKEKEDEEKTHLTIQNLQLKDPTTTSTYSRKLKDPTQSLHIEKVDLLLHDYSSDQNASMVKSFEKSVYFHSPFIWNFFENECAALELGSHGRILVFRTPEGVYRVVRFTLDSLDLPEPVPIIHRDLPLVLRATDTFIVRTLGIYPLHLLRSAAWRKLPITPGQFNWLSVYFKKPEDFELYNRGKASSLIQKTMLRSWFKTLDIQKISKMATKGKDEESPQK